MRSKLLNLLSVSLATSVLLAPTSQAFAQNPESQATTKEAQSLVHHSESIKGADTQRTPNEGRLQEGKALNNTQLLPVTATSPTTQPNQLNSAEQTDQILIGLFITLVFIYILAGLEYRRQRVHRAAILLQQIETLERIWKMKSHR